jgi:peptidoglycan-N-acetylmuramic acid deacetylase
MKKIFVLAFSILLLISFSVNVFANASDAASWYVKRNGEKRPILDEKQKIIYRYDGYYIDERLSDDSNERKLYLTFDLGYENGNTARILDVLKKNNVKAAFFILDNIIVKNRDLVTQMINDGHLICNHSKNHKDLSNKTRNEIREDLSALEDLMLKETGRELDKYFRFPEGRYSTSALKAVSELGYKTIFWSFAYEDWDNARQMSAEKAFNKIISNTHNGAIMLFHPTSKTNADIFERLINKWKEMGYQFSTLDELTK